MCATDDGFVSLQTVYTIPVFFNIEFCEVVMFKPWIQYVIENCYFFFFLATRVSSFRITTPYLTVQVNRQYYA